MTPSTDIMQRIRTFIKNRTKWQIAGFVLLVVVGFFVFGGGNGVREEILVSRGVIEQEVVATGKIRSAEEVDLGFERVGRVVGVNADVGDLVNAGDTLVLLDQTELLANLKKARASLAETEIILDKSLKTTALDSSNSYEKLYSALVNTYTEARDAVLNTSDQFFNQPESYSPYFEIIYISNNQTIRFYVTDDEAARAIAVKRSQIGSLLTEWATVMDGVRVNKGDLTNAVALTEKNVDTIKFFLSDLAYLVNSAQGSTQTEEGILDGFKASVSTARTSLNTSLSNLLGAKQDYLSSPKQLLTSGGLSYDSILEEQAKFDVALAEVESLESQLAKTVLKSPISGVVTKQDAKVGQIVTAGEVTTSVISQSALEVEADISEVNIGKIREGNEVSIRLDAFPDNVLQGLVSNIEPGEKLVDGVVNYEITVAFVGDIPVELKRGLTASLNIQTQKKEDVLRVPSYTVERRDGVRFVFLKNLDGGVEEREVMTGLVGRDGFVEVISGLNEGDIVLGATI